MIAQQLVSKPQQVRSRKTMDSVLAVAEDLVAQGLFARTPVAEIARRAGTSVGAFYARFRDKDALLHVLQERFVERLEGAVDEMTHPSRWAGRSLPVVVHGLVAGAARLLRTERGGFGSLMTGWRVRGWPEARERMRRVNQRLWDGVEVLLLEWADEIAHPRPELAIRVGWSSVVWTLREHLVFGVAGVSPVRVTDDDLVSELATALLSYLQATSM